MRASVAALLLVVCSLLVAACGDSGSSSTTASVPTTRIGAAGATSCTPPRVNGLTVHAVSATGISCEAATSGTLDVIKTNKHGGYSCRQTISGRNVRASCTNSSDANQSFSAAWSVS